MDPFVIARELMWREEVSLMALMAGHLSVSGILRIVFKRSRCASPEEKG